MGHGAWGMGHWLLVIGYWLLVIGYWLLVIGYWLLVIGYWLLVTSFVIRHGIRRRLKPRLHKRNLPPQVEHRTAVETARSSKQLEW
ncbi:hypothetical protein [Microcoleus sp. PH2017_09_SFU_O_A]|uniref:hypothetical protein n=1 Tax=Microcoleus sp. PH2017_09_SFU_O_A TaxID=2798820 RepID=UPI0025EAF4D3|nr:hypothetical protein [Microcoleus sp. PH2017_09_SFU_O_A]